MSGLHVEPSPGTPLVWFSVVLRAGATLDPPGLEGLTRHAGELLRRGAGGLDRAGFDAAVDALGGSLEVDVDRDSIELSGMCLARNLDALLGLAAAALAEPTMAAAEHDQLLRETHHELDELRDDDGSLADRCFTLRCAPGHPYGRTVLGTEASLGRICLDDARAHRARLMRTARPVVGFAGAIDAEAAAAAAARLRAALGPGDLTPPADVVVQPPRGRRIIVVDKPARTQCQMLIGHGGPANGTDDFAALLPTEVAFGGMFSSRLMQAIRVQRGWSYGAGCRLGRARLGQWFRIYLAPTAEVAADALALTLDLYRGLVADGLTADELDFSKRYLLGGLALARQTARQRMRQRLSHDVLDLGADHADRVAARIAALDGATVDAAARRWLTPDDLCAVLVATADRLVPKLEAAGLAVAEVVPYDGF